MTTKCKCRTCDRIREFHVRLQSVPAESKEYFSDVFNLLLETQEDVSYYRAILDGSWPNAKEVLDTALNRLVTHE